METPPPYGAAPKKSKTGLIIGLVIGGIVLCCVGPIVLLAGGGFFVFNESKPFISCSLGIRQLRNAMVTYAEKNGGKLPNSKSWYTDIRPEFDKTKSEESEGNPFGNLPANGIFSCSSGSEAKTTIAFNSALSGKSLAEIKKNVATIVLFETAGSGPNLSAPYKAQPKETSPKLFGKPRGWLTINLSGAALASGKEVDVSANGSSVKVESKTSTGTGN